jgi:hypothetical protein
MTIWVLKNPDAYTRARVIEVAESPGAGWEEMTWQELEAWRASQPPLPQPPPVEEPDWNGMETDLRLQNGFKDAFLAAMPTEPMAVGSLTSRFDDFKKDGNFIPFLESLFIVLSVLEPQMAAHTALEFLALAHLHHMPTEFINALQQMFLDQQ